MINIVKILLFSLCLFASKASADTDWYRVAANTTLVADWAQTIEIAKNDRFYERNPYLGRYPTTSEVNAYFITSILLINIVGEYAIPLDSKSYFYAGITTIETLAILNNYSIGVRVAF